MHAAKPLRIAVSTHYYSLHTSARAMTILHEFPWKLFLPKILTQRQSTAPAVTEESDSSISASLRSERHTQHQAIFHNRGNAFSLTRHLGPVKQKFVIDQSLQPSQDSTSQQPQLEGSDTLKYQPNLLVDVLNGPIQAEVQLIGRDDTQQSPPPRVRLRLGSKNGPVTVKITSTPFRSPITLAAYSGNGTVALLLPRDFRGPLHLTTFHGQGRLSQDLSQAVSLFGDSGEGERTYFVGKFDDYTAGDPDGWTGDAAFAATTSGCVAVLYADEGSEKADYTIIPGMQQNW